MFTHPVKYMGRLIPGYTMNDRSEIYSDRSHKVLRPFPNKERKPVVCMIDECRKKMFRLDYLVISTFDRYHDDIIRVIHVDENPFNCMIDNLVVLRKVDIIERYKEMYHVERLEDICEEWKNHPYIPEIEVSNFGEVRLTNTKKLCTQYESHDYMMIYLHGKHHQVHRLVAETFIENPKPDDYTLVNHLDGNKSNNIFWNLEWCNGSMNTEHAQLSGLQQSYDEKTVRDICALLEQGVPQVDISNITGVNRKYISDIYRGRRRKDISSQYAFNKKVPLEDRYNRNAMLALMKSGYKGKEIAHLLRFEYNQSFISYYERLRRELVA